MNYKISIIIPVYNVQEYIIKCLDSVAKQTFNGEIECIIVDDCGNDSSIELYNKWIKRYSGPINFKLIHHKHNRGLAAARNTGLDNSTGDFIMHLDSDDWLEPEAVDLLVKKQLETNADIVSGNAIAHYQDHTQNLTEPNYANKTAMLHAIIKLTLDHVLWRRLIRRSLYTKNNIYAIEGVDIGEDHHTLPRLVYYANSIAKVDSIIYHYNCMNAYSYMNNTSKGFNLKRYNNDKQSIQILKRFFIDKDSSIISDLNNIESNYIKRNKKKALIKLKDKISYDLICRDQGISSDYFICLLKKRVITFILFGLLIAISTFLVYVSFYFLYLNSAPPREIKIVQPTHTYLHFSLDDVRGCTTRLSVYNNNSAFTDSTLYTLKQWHDKYGICASLFVQGDFCINSKYAQEFINNSSWLKFGYHGTRNNISDIWKFYNQIRDSIGSDNVIDNLPRLHFFHANKLTCNILQYCGCIGFLSCDDWEYNSSKRESNYYLSAEQSKLLDADNRILDSENRLLFVKTDFRLEQIKKRWGGGERMFRILYQQPPI